MDAKSETALPAKNEEMIRRYEGELKAAYKDGRLDQARKLAEALKKIDPENYMALRLMEKMAEAEKESAQKASEVKIKMLEDQLKKAFDEGRLSLVDKVFEELKKIDPENKAAKKIEGLVTDAKKTIEKEVRAEKMKALTAQLEDVFRKKDLARTVQAANDLLKLEWDQKAALRVLKEVAKMKRVKYETLITAPHPVEEKKEGLWAKWLKPAVPAKSSVPQAPKALAPVKAAEKKTEAPVAVKAAEKKAPSAEKEKPAAVIKKAKAWFSAWFSGKKADLKAPAKAVPASTAVIPKPAFSVVAPALKISAPIPVGPIAAKPAISIQNPGQGIFAPAVMIPLKTDAPTDAPHVAPAPIPGQKAVMPPAPVQKAPVPAPITVAPAVIPRPAPVPAKTALAAEKVKSILGSWFFRKKENAKPPQKTEKPTPLGLKTEKEVVAKPIPSVSRKMPEGNVFTALFQKEQGVKPPVSIIDTIVSGAGETKEGRRKEKNVAPDTGGMWLKFASAFMEFALAFILITAGFFYVQNMDTGNQILNFVAKGTKNNAVRLHEAGIALEKIKQEKKDTEQEIRKFKGGYQDEYMEVIQKIKGDRMDWPDIIGKLNEVTSSVYEKNDLTQYVQYNNFSYNAENGRLAVSATLTDPLWKNLTKLAELEEAFRYYPADPKNTDVSGGQKPYFYGLQEFRSFSKTFNAALNRYVSAFSLSLSTRPPK